MTELVYELEEKMNEYKKRKQIRKGYRRSQFIIFAARNIIGPIFKKVCNMHNEKKYSMSARNVRLSVP